MHSSYDNNNSIIHKKRPSCVENDFGRYYHLIALGAFLTAFSRLASRFFKFIGAFYTVEHVVAWHQKHLTGIGFAHCAGCRS